MKWLELSVTTPPEFVEPLSQIFYRYGQGGVAAEQEGGFNPDEGESPPTDAWVTLKTYLPLNSTTQDRRNRIDLGVRLVAHVSDITPLRERIVEEEEWENAWKDHFEVLRIGQRTVIRPTWREYDPKESDLVISLDPGMAFGTGHHPTTRMCLEVLENLVKPGIDVLDVGCGSGILSIAAAKLGARSVLGLEIDSVALKVAKQNVRDNRVSYVVRVAEGTLPHPAVREHGYDLSLINISAKVVSDLAWELARAAKPGGRVVASGILDERSDSVRSALAAAGCRVEERLADGDWIALVLSTA